MKVRDNAKEPTLLWHAGKNRVFFHHEACQLLTCQSFPQAEGRLQGGDEGDQGAGRRPGDGVCPDGKDDAAGKTRGRRLSALCFIKFEIQQVT